VGELDLEREKDLSAEREGRVFPERWQPSPITDGLLRLKRSATAREMKLHGGEALG
jgi:hypothetical protein